MHEFVLFKISSPVTYGKRDLCVLGVLGVLQGILMLNRQSQIRNTALISRSTSSWAEME